MIITEVIGDRIRSYSDRGMKLRQVETGILYDDAVDMPNKYTYEETDILIEPNEITDADKAEAYDILIGEAE